MKTIFNVDNEASIILLTRTFSFVTIYLALLTVNTMNSLMCVTVFMILMIGLIDPATAAIDHSV